MKKLLLTIAAKIATFFARQAPAMPQTLEDALRVGWVRLKYRKLNGEFSEHVGTRNLGLLPKERLPKGRKASDKVVPFYSQEAEDWRSISRLPHIFDNVQWSLIS